MLIFLYGPNSYGRRQKIKEIVGQYEKKHPFLVVENFDFDDDKNEFLRLNDFFSSPTLFENIKLAVAENVLKAVKEKENKESKKQASLLVKLLKANLENKDLILIISEESKPTKELNFLLENPVLFQKFENLKGSQFEQFIKKEIEVRGMKIDNNVIVLMARIFEGDMWGLMNEFNKLSLFNKKISLKEFNEIVGYQEKIGSSDFFRQVSNFAFSRGVSQKIVNLEILIEAEDPAKIFNFLASFSSNSKDLVMRFADYDVAIKSGKIDYEEALTDLAISC